VWWDDKAHQTVLACESEWGNPDEVEYDFEKLLSFKSPLKLLIYGDCDAEQWKETHKRIKGVTTKFSQHVKGEVYVIVEFSFGKCFSYWFRVPADKKLEQFRLEPLNDAAKRRGS